MSRSLTTTATTVASQRLLTAPKWLEYEASFKQLTLRLDASPQYRLLSQQNDMRTTHYHQAPINRLPVELLSYIFLLGAHTPDLTNIEGGTLPDEGRDSISPCLSSSTTTPDVFAAVSRYWRDVALGTPQLWTRICVTIGDVIYSGGGPIFSTVSRYLSRSARCPLDILIDARDEDWDFSEVDSVGAVVSPYIDETYDYTHPFKVEHMHHVLNILLPHVRRFRSLAILTDRWAPMQTALDCLSMEIPAFVSAPRPLPPSLPLLETLVLMRCNEYASYHSEFSPADQKDPAHLPFSGLLRASEEAHAHESILPGLKKLVLSGVHTQWTNLPRLLPAQHAAPTQGLETLQLSYHCNEVRPSERDFMALLGRCTRLKELTVCVSGPKSPDSPRECVAPPEGEPLPLPRLETITLEYDDPYTAATIIDMIDAPEARHLVLKDASSPGGDDRLDAEPLLFACTTSSSQMKLAAGQPPFPRVESLSLCKVDASAEAFEGLYEALPNLRALTVSQMFLLGGDALHPNVELAFEPPELPPSRRVVESIYSGGDLIAQKLEMPRDPQATGVI